METCSDKLNLLAIDEIPTPTPTPAPASPPPWIELPSDVTANILQRLGAVEILKRAEKVCCSWWKLCHDPTMWREIKIAMEYWESKREYITMCRIAVDRSQGQLIDLTIDGFGNGDLLLYIADRSSELRRLTLACCNSISLSIALTDAIKKFPKLEELHLIQIECANLEAIGIACPLLNSFTYNQSRYEYIKYYDEAVDASNERAAAIATSMPNLRRLRLFANLLDNKGLLAILDGCPRLESLDLRECSGVDLEGALGVRCREQIKDFQLPSDSVGDYDYDLRDNDDLSNVSDDFPQPDFHYGSDYSSDFN